MRTLTNSVKKKISIVLFLFCLSICLLASCSTSIEKKPPNILFIAVDDMRPELGCYETDYVKSPGIDRLAENGIVFTQAYCQSAVCIETQHLMLLPFRNILRIMVTTLLA
jgi:iduronate 2-sulfatase